MRHHLPLSSHASRKSRSRVCLFPNSLDSDRPRPKALKLQGLNKALAKALTIFGRKFRLGQALEHHVLFPSSFRRRCPFWQFFLFISVPKPDSIAQFLRARKPSARVMEEKEILVQALADEEEDARPDEGAIEIDSDEEYQ
ncbi:hypothetical protein C8R44DRAFT_748562 [Mycena epipterygia]|nr:hypothetical protein C8R44DRAFT_748562 [Mycena epipterygia]